MTYFFLLKENAFVTPKFIKCCSKYLTEKNKTKQKQKQKQKQNKKKKKTTDTY